MSAAFTVTAVDLRRALSDVLPFAGTGDTLPTLTTVRIHTTPTSLVFTTTDRYMIGRSFVDVTDPETVEGVMLKTVDAREIVRYCKGLGSGTAVLGIAADKVSVAGGDGRSLTFTPYDGQDFPPSLDRILAEAAEREIELDEPIGLNPEFLARFSKVTREPGHAPVRLSFGGSRTPAYVEIGEHFVGAIMPVRLAEPRDDEVAA